MSSEIRSKGTGPLPNTERGSGRLRPPATSVSSAADTPRASKSGPLHSPLKLSPSEYNTAMVHFYRGEVQRSNTWRNRLDTTTNWAVITAGATLSFVFSSPSNPHFVIPINSILVAIFLIMEARRYRYYEIWSSRVRVMETGYFAPMLAPGGSEVYDEEWAAHLAADLITPHFTISEWEAIGRRLRRNYLWIFALLALSWNLKVYLHPLPAYNFDVFLDRATVGLVPGAAILIAGVIFNVAVFLFAVFTVRLREATGEVLPRHEFALRPLHAVTNWTRAAAAASSRRRATTRRAKQARQRVRTSSTATGEFKKLDISEVPNREIVKEETILK
ncbi:MAG TPA: DUF2270 domain-containing protein [Pyrinomonadaceae bacterium]